MTRWTASTWIRWISAIVAAAGVVTVILLGFGNRIGETFEPQIPAGKVTATDGPPGTFLLRHLHPHPSPTVPKNPSVGHLNPEEPK
ncbi:MAG: hypothetical protein ACYTHM_01970 [Planctomycetota bacterium]|jgi:hypothetical protein